MISKEMVDQYYREYLEADRSTLSELETKIFEVFDEPLMRTGHSMKVLHELRQMLREKGNP